MRPALRVAALPTLIALWLATGAATVPDAPLGIWRNPKDSVHIRMHPCGERLCGTVIWANAKAQEDAREGGTDPLVGARLFRDFKLQRPGVWRGRVFVPDINMTFSGTITVVDERTITGRGCLIAGLGCKSQTWVRYDALATPRA